MSETFSGIVQAILATIASAPFVSSLAGAFFGTFAAFLLEAGRRGFEDKRKRYEAILATQAVLLSQGNSILSVYKQISATGDLNPFDNLKQLVFAFSKQVLDFGRLTFLGESVEDNLLLDLEVAQESFHRAISLVDLRNSLLEKFLNEPESEIEEFNPGSGQTHATGASQLSTNLKQANKETFKAFRDAHEKNREVRVRFYAFAQKMYPRKKLLFLLEDAVADEIREAQTAGAIRK